MKTQDIIIQPVKVNGISIGEVVLKGTISSNDIDDIKTAIISKSDNYQKLHLNMNEVEGIDWDALQQLYSLRNSISNTEMLFDFAL